MADNPPSNFPNLKSKLSNPLKKSAFEKSKAEAEAKRLREEAETKAVYEDFVKSFADDSDDEFSRLRSGRDRDDSFGSGGPALRGKPPVGPSTGQRRHFTTSAKGIGPPPLPSQNKFGRKRGLDLDDGDWEVRDKSRRLGGGGLLAFENSGAGDKDSERKRDREEYFKADEDDEEEEREKEQPKPTIHLRDLPSKYEGKDVRELIKSVAPNLQIEGVRILPTQAPPSSSQTSIRRSNTALVTLAIGTSASDIDTCTSSLQNRYLGCGFWLSISRHLPSTIAGHDTLSLLSSNSNAQPFGARVPTGPVNRLSRAPPPGGFAPPGQFGGQPQHSNFQNHRSRLEVHVVPPRDLKLLKLIHKTIESILTHGPEFEALLMSRPDIQTDEKWAWLWDTRSDAHNYYLWRLWDIFTGTSALDSNHSSLRTPVEMFIDGSNQLPVWIPPRKRLKYEFATSLADVVNDPEYRSEDEDSDSEAEAGEERRPGGLGIGGEEKKRAYLTPLQRGKLIHLIARVPTSTTKVRRGDIGRVMAFAVEHAWAAEEIVDVLVSNIIRPFALQKDFDRGDDGYSSSEQESGEEAAKTRAEDRERETWGAKVVGLYIINDVLSNSSLGIRNVWRYRTLVETKLREARVMEELGRVPEKEGWGRIRRDKYERLVKNILGLWENWCIFPQTSHEALRAAFLDPPQTKATVSTSQPQSSFSISAPAPAPKSRWRTLDSTAEAKETTPYNPFAPPSLSQAQTSTVSTMPATQTQTQSEVQEMDEDIDGEPMLSDDENLDGEPMTPSEDEDEPPSESLPSVPEANPLPEPGEEEDKAKGNEDGKKVQPGMGIGFGAPLGFSMKKAEGAGRRKRVRAEDMFAEDDDD